MSTEQKLREALQEAMGWNWLSEDIPRHVVAKCEQALAAESEQGEPRAWLFQHDETGRTMCIDVQQVEYGFEANNPRLQKIAPLYTHPKQLERLTAEEIEAADLVARNYYRRHRGNAGGQMFNPADNYEYHLINAIQDAMIKKNGGVA